VKLPSLSIVIVPPCVVGAFVTGSATRLACGVSGSVSFVRTEPVISLPASPAGLVVPTNRLVLPIASNESATAVGASETPLTVRLTVAVDCALAASRIVYWNESVSDSPVDNAWNAAGGVYVYDPLALIVTDPPSADEPVSVPEPFSATTVFVSAGSKSVSLASTPGAATVSGVSSSVVPVSSTAVGGSLTAVTWMARVSEPVCAASSVTLNVTVRVSVDGACEPLKNVTSRSAA